MGGRDGRLQVHLQHCRLMLPWGALQTGRQDAEKHEHRCHEHEWWLGLVGWIFQNVQCLGGGILREMNVVCWGLSRGAHLFPPAPGGGVVGTSETGNLDLRDWCLTTRTQAGE